MTSSSMPNNVTGDRELKESQHDLGLVHAAPDSPRAADQLLRRITVGPVVKFSPSTSDS
jgi:hypothetical protein